VSKGYTFVLNVTLGGIYFVFNKLGPAETFELGALSGWFLWRGDARARMGLGVADSMTVGWPGGFGVILCARRVEGVAALGGGVNEEFRPSRPTSTALHSPPSPTSDGVG
jgi:hypothetical protein